MKDQLRQQAQEIYQQALKTHQQHHQPYQVKNAFVLLDKAIDLLNQCNDIKDQRTIADWYLSFANTMGIRELYYVRTPIQCYLWAEDALKRLQSNTSDKAEQQQLMRERAECLANIGISYFQEAKQQESSREAMLRRRWAVEEWHKAAELIKPLSANPKKMDTNDARKYIYYLTQLVAHSENLADWAEISLEIKHQRKREQERESYGLSPKSDSDETMLMQFHGYISEDKKLYYKAIIWHYPQAIQVANRINDKTEQDYETLIALHEALASAYAHSGGKVELSANFKKAIAHSTILIELLEKVNQADLEKYLNQLKEYVEKYCQCSQGFECPEAMKAKRLLARYDSQNKMEITQEEPQTIKEAIVVTGVTGSGSSTLINRLCGVEYQLKKDIHLGSYFLHPLHNQIIPTEIGHSCQQQTLSAQLVEGKNFSFIDCPAINDTQETSNSTHNNNIYNQLGVLPLLEKTDKIRALIMVIDWASLDINHFRSSFSHGNKVFSGLAHILKTLVKDPQSLVSNAEKPLLLFAISKLPVPQRDTEFSLDELKTQVATRISILIQAIEEDKEHFEPILFVLNLMNQQLKNIFLIRGYSGGQQEQEDDQNLLLRYLEELKKQDLKIAHSQFFLKNPNLSFSVNRSISFKPSPQANNNKAPEQVSAMIFN